LLLYNVGSVLKQLEKMYIVGWKAYNILAIMEE
jgi:hypothetical protein